MISSKAYKFIYILTVKGLKSLFRQQSIRNLIIFSILIVYVGLYLVWYSSRNQTLHYLSSYGYSHLSFDYNCKPDLSTSVTSMTLNINHITSPQQNSHLICHPGRYSQNNQESSQILTPSSILSNIITTGNMFGGDSNSENHQTSELTNLLSSLMMNGLPILGMKDYVRISDFINNHLGQSGKETFLSYTAYNEKFGNFLDVRKKEVRIISNPSCISHTFEKYLNDKLGTENKISIRSFDIMDEVIKDCCDNLFAIVDIFLPLLEDGRMDNSLCENDYFSLNSTISMSVPEITIRMHPLSVADTRNFKWTPRRNSFQRYQSGQLLYQLSGFLSLQFEIQNFLSLHNFGGEYIDTNIFQDTTSLLNSNEYSKIVAKSITTSLLTSTSIFDELVNSTNKIPHTREKVKVPIYHRAFPTHQYEQSVFWHTFGSILTIVLVMLFSVPAAVIGGEYRKDISSGHLDILSTFPFIRQYHSSLSWCVCGMIWIIIITLFTWIYFISVLKHSYSIIPCVTLLLCGWCLGPISIILGLALKRSEEIALATPSLVFVFMIPGMLYTDLAFDIQRNVWIELFLCLLPSSAAALALRHIFGYEALGVAVTWTYPVPISQTPTYYYIVMLCVDNVIYGLLSIALVYYFEPIKNKQYNLTISNNQNLSERIARYITNCSDAIITSFFNRISSIHSYFTRRFTISSSQEYILISPISSYDAMSDTNQNTSHQRNRSYSESYFSPDKPSIGNDSINNSNNDDYSHIDISENQENKPDIQKEKIAMTIEHISKRYKTNNVIIEVLSDITTKLLYRTIYSLLGSNGAGKTTFLRILCGLDANFIGSIVLTDTKTNHMRAKSVGWCPQVDPIFEQLTVEEHLDLLGELLDIAYDHSNTNLTSSSSFLSWKREEYKIKLLSELDMLFYRHKYGYELSGGMKRRLSLAMAFLGDPSILLLDEPSTGCDSWNRELIRIAILGRKQISSILVSTHHMDDIEVLSDHILFLNERHLVYDGTYSDLIRGQSYGNNHDAHSDHDDHISYNEKDSLLFSSSDSVIIEEFTQIVDAHSNIISVIQSNNNSNSSISKWLVQYDGIPLLKSFLQSLENKNRNSWTLISPTLNNCIERMYSLQSFNPIDHEIHLKLTHHQFNNIHHHHYHHQYHRFRNKRIQMIFNYFRHFLLSFKAIFMMRWLELKSCLFSYTIVNLFIPCVIVLIISIGCRDVKYPKMELSSELIGGLGEIMVGYNSHPLSNNPKIIPKDHQNKYPSDDQTFFDRSKEFLRSKVPSSNQYDNIQDVSTFTTISSKTELDKKENVKKENQNNKDYPGYEFLEYHLQSEQFLWKDKISSSKLWKELFSEYYFHEYDRWNAFVLEDNISDWIESSVTINELDFPMDVNMTNVYLDIIHAKERICNSSHTLKSYPTKYKDDVNDGHSIIYICDSQHSTISFTLSNISSNPIDTKKNINNLPEDGENSKESKTNVSYQLIIKAYQSLYSNLTILSNVSAYHATPIFFKEIVPLIYRSLYNLPSYSKSNNYDEDSSHIHSKFERINKPMVPNYKLHSYPLPVINLSNEIYIERGYIGSVLILFYMLIISIKSIRMITYIRSIGMKTLLHSKGLDCSHYWLSNAIVDSMLNFLSYLAIGIGVLIGGNPVSSYYIQSHPIIDQSIYSYSIYGYGMLYLIVTILFSFAITIANYCYSILSSNQLSSQLLLLISTIVNGVFLKLYFDRHKGIYIYDILSSLFLYLSPSYTLSTCFFEIFRLHAVNTTVSYVSHRSNQHNIVDKAMAAFLIDSHRIIGYCLVLLLLHSIIYMMIGIAIDRYNYRITSNWKRIYHILRLYYRTLCLLYPFYSKSSMTTSMNAFTYNSHHDGHLDSYDDNNSNNNSNNTRSTEKSTSKKRSEHPNKAIVEPLTGDESREENRNIYERIDIPDSERGYIELQSYRTNSLSFDEMNMNYPIDHNTVLYNQINHYDTDTHTDLENRDEEKIIHSNRSGILRHLHRWSRGNIGLFPTIDDPIHSNSTQDKKTSRDMELVSNLSTYSNQSVDEAICIDTCYTNPISIDLKSQDLNQKDKKIILSSSSSSPNSYPILTIENLYIEYPKTNLNNITSHGAEQKISAYAIKGVDLHIHPNERVALMGSSGSGKSTLFKAIALAENIPISGHIQVHTMVNNSRKSYDMIHDIWDIGSNGYIGYVPQEKGLLEYLTVKQALELFYRLSKSISPSYRITSNNKSSRSVDKSSMVNHSIESDVDSVISQSIDSDTIGFNSIESDYDTDNDHDNQTMSKDNDDFDSFLTTIMDHGTENMDNLKSIKSQGIIPMKYLNYPIYALSGGNKKKIMLILSQIGSPNILLFDEVTSGVDPLAADRIIHYLRNQYINHSKHSFMSDNKSIQLTSMPTSPTIPSILFASHRIDECYSLCDRVLIMNQGKFIFNGPIQSFETLSTAFYQIDILSTSSLSQSHILFDLDNLCYRHGYSYERKLIYNTDFVRITFERECIPLTSIWDWLDEMKGNGLVKRYAFREMNMEEALSSIIASTKL